MQEKITHFLAIICFLCFTNICVSQGNKIQGRKIIQFSGVVVNSADLSPVPFVNIGVEGTYRGTSSDANGFYTFVALTGETITFSCIGFSTASYTIPHDLEGDHYSIVQSIVNDTIELEETVIYPWPSKEKFKEAFLSVQLPEREIDLIQKNFSLAEIRERAKAGKMDAGMNYRNFIQDKTDRLYYAGQVTPNNLLNPFAWAAFLKQWNAYQEAKKKEKKKNDYEDY